MTDNDSSLILTSPLSYLSPFAFSTLISFPPGGYIDCAFSAPTDQAGRRPTDPADWPCADLLTMSTGEAANSAVDG